MDFDRKAILIPLALIVVVLVGVYAYMRYAPAGPKLPAELDVHHTVMGNKHTYSGEVLLPICSTLSNTVTVAGPTISLALVAAPTAGCNTKGEAAQAFSGSVTLPDEPQLREITLNGMEMPYTLIEDSTLDDTAL